MFNKIFIISLLIATPSFTAAPHPADDDICALLSNPAFPAMQKLEGRREVIRICKKTGLALCAMGAAGCSYVYYQYYNRDREKEFEAATHLGNMFGYVISPMMIANMLAEPIKSAGMSAYHRMTGKTTEKSPLRKIGELKAFLAAEEFSPEIKKLVGDNLERAEALANRSDASKAGSDDSVKKIIANAANILALPTKLKDFGSIYRKDDPQVAFIRNRLEQVKRNYPSAVRQQIDDMAIRVMSGVAGVKNAVYFLGAPGTGKTKLALELAEALDVPFINLSAAEKASELFGYQGSSSGRLEDIKELKRFTKELLGAKDSEGRRYLNGLIFIDEIDKPLNASGSPFSGDAYENNMLKEALLKLFDPDAKKSRIRLGDLGVEIDTSSYLIIAAGNAPIKESAIASRLSTIVFPAFDYKDRLAIARRSFQTHINSFQEKFPEFQVSTPQEALVEQIVRADSHDGVRDLLMVIKQYAFFLLEENRPGNTFPRKVFAYEDAFGAQLENSSSPPLEALGWRILRELVK